MTRDRVPEKDIINYKDLAHNLFTLAIAACPSKSDRAQLTRLFHEMEEESKPYYHYIATQFARILNTGLQFDRWSQYGDTPNPPPIDDGKIINPDITK